VAGQDFGNIVGPLDTSFGIGKYEWERIRSGGRLEMAAALDDYTAADAVVQATELSPEASLSSMAFVSVSVEHRDINGHMVCTAGTRNVADELPAGMA
jgi:hypothetical protein